MDDSDDYIVDDIVFDDRTLAVLDQEEKKYLQQSSVTTTSEGHINKRHKTSTGWKPGIGADLKSADSYDDLPEISLRVDGSYGIGIPVQTAKTSMPGFVAQDSRRKQSTSAVDNHYPPRNVSQSHAPGSGPQDPSKASLSTVRANPQIPKARVQEYPGTRQNTPQVPTELHNQMLELQKRLEEVSARFYSRETSESTEQLCADAQREFENTVSIERCC